MELEEFLISFVSLETWKPRFVFVPREGTWNEALTGEWNGKIAGSMARENSVEVRRQHLLTTYFDLSSTEELEKCLVNYQHTSASLTTD